MRIIWSDFAFEMLSEIYEYHKEVARERIAQKFKKNIFAATKQLTSHPHSEQIEKTLEQLEEGHRYLVLGNYKHSLQVS